MDNYIRSNVCSFTLSKYTTQISFDSYLAFHFIFKGKYVYLTMDYVLHINSILIRLVLQYVTKSSVESACHNESLFKAKLSTKSMVAF